VSISAALALGFGFIALFAFLLGSIPWGVIISRLFYRVDIREHGSGNIGTTNALRTLGKLGGVAVFMLDFAKGMLAGFMALRVGATMDTFGLDPLGPFALGPLALGPFALEPPVLQEIAVALGLLACVSGHIFSPWLHFRGGKGIAVAIGCLFITLGWIPAVIELAIFAVLVAATRYVSVGSIVTASLCLPFALVVFWGNPVAVILCGAAGLLIVWAHRGNIARLRSGTENRVGKRKAA
jgi:glycerol-3-phosphate acyltransferase PlsY